MTYIVRRESIGKRVEDYERRIAYDQADIGRFFGMDRIALHHIFLEQGFRTSLPHAESHEEEFVLILKGAPSVWLDGVLYSLEEGDFVGFPSGTGSSHTFINNGSAVCELLVAGEKTKPFNRCSFVMDPQMEKENPFIWWANPPKIQVAGDSPLPATGLIGETRISRRPVNIQNWRFLRESLPFSYPTCERKETFTVGRDLTEAGTLERIGMYMDRLAPGKRSSWPHAHKYEDELLYVLDGRVNVWVNGELYPAQVGDFIGFKAGTGDCHTIINDSSEDAVLFVLGERTSDFDDRIYYSHHQAQNELNKSRGRFWTDRPDRPMGSASPEARL